MNFRKLGKTGILVSEIGFGAWGIGGGSYGPVDDNESKRALEFAFANGISFYDTSDLYGNGHSEELIGKTFKSIRNQIVIATKVGCLPHTGREMPQDFSAGHIRQSIEASLKRLQTDYVDLYQLHSPLINILANEEVLKTLQNLKKEGKIRAIGISVRSPADGLIAVKKYAFECIQVNFNLIDQRTIGQGLFDLAKKEQVGIIARTPFCFGFLTGKYSDKTTFASGDHRLNWPKRQLRQWADAASLFSPFAEGKCSLAQLALKFCLSYDAVSVVIPGMMKIEEVKENIKASQIADLSEQELRDIEEIYKKNVFFDPLLRRPSDSKQ